MEEPARSIAQAIGALPTCIDAVPCAFNVGDTITFTEFPRVAYQVVRRLYEHSNDPGQSKWLVELQELAADHA